MPKRTAGGTKVGGNGTTVRHPATIGRAPAEPKEPAPARETRRSAPDVPTLSLDELRKKKADRYKGKACQCPSCRTRFFFDSKDGIPNPNDPIPCPGCAREFPFERYFQEAENRDNSFGPWELCDNVLDHRKGTRCGERYRIKAMGSGPADPETGRGGVYRCCPKCGALPKRIRPRQRLASPGIPDGDGPPVRTAQPGPEDATPAGDPEWDASALPKR